MSSESQTTPRVLVPLATGFEEMEAMIIIDVLRRAGAEVIAAGLSAGPIVASRGTRHLADVLLSEIADDDFDLVVLPGGAEGARRLGEDARLAELLHRHNEGGAGIGAICAAPNVLRNAGIIGADDEFTMHPGALDGGCGGLYCAEQRLVRCRNVLTSIGPGSAFEFALQLVEDLCGSERRAAVAAPMHLS